MGIPSRISVIVGLLACCGVGEMGAQGPEPAKGVDFSDFLSVGGVEQYVVYCQLDESGVRPQRESTQIAQPAVAALHSLNDRSRSNR